MYKSKFPPQEEQWPDQIPCPTQSWTSKCYPTRSDSRNWCAILPNCYYDSCHLLFSFSVLQPFYQTFAHIVQRFFGTSHNFLYVQIHGIFNPLFEIKKLETLYLLKINYYRTQRSATSFYPHQLQLKLYVHLYSFISECLKYMYKYIRNKCGRFFEMQNA